jgi:hypothetical protein
MKKEINCLKFQVPRFAYNSLIVHHSFGRGG